MKKNNLVLSMAVVGAISCATTANSATTMLGAFVQYDGWSLTTIDRFNTETGKPMAVTTLFTNFDMHWDSLNIQASNIVSRGAMPMITLMPDADRSDNMLAAIAAGDEDVYVNGWIQSFKAWRDSYPEGQRPTILLRFAHEFNGNWYPWGNNPEALKTAWRHIHSMFEAAGVNDSVEWVWCASATDVDDYNDVTVYYPGDDVVDWTGLDGYNWGSNYAWTSWRSFDEVFSSAYVTLATHFPDKPVVLAEVASTEASDLPDAEWGQNGNDTDAGESKELWVSDMLSSITADYPAIRAISWFNINKELSWALTEIAQSGLPNTGLTAYQQGVQNESYSSTFTPLNEVTEGNDSGGKGKNKPDKTTDGNADKGGGKNKRTAAETVAVESNIPLTTTAEQRLTGIDKATSVSRMPEVVGIKLREKQAEGFRNMSAEALKKIRAERLKLGF